MTTDEWDEIAAAERGYRQGAPALGRALRLLAARWEGGARDEPTILRLLFLIWYRVVEPPALTGLPAHYERPSFQEVFESVGGETGSSPLTLWAVGKMAEVAPWALGDETRWRAVSPLLFERARTLRPGLTGGDFTGMGAAGDYFRHLAERG